MQHLSIEVQKENNFLEPEVQIKIDAQRKLYTASQAPEFHDTAFDISLENEQSVKRIYWSKTFRKRGQDYKSSDIDMISGIRIFLHDSTGKLYTSKWAPVNHIYYERFHQLILEKPSITFDERIKRVERGDI